MIYLTYGDVDSPIYHSQVVGFCDFLREKMEMEVQIVAFVPMRLYFAQKKKLAAYGKGIKVLPVVNRFQSNPWYSIFNAFLIKRMNPASIMTRNPAGLNVCREIQREEKPFFYDARGCQHMEMEEFSNADQAAIQEMKQNEVQCFKKADWVFSVSGALIEYFKDNHRYKDHNHSIIPCCVLDTDYSKKLSKKELFGTEDVMVFCYAGALSVWNYPRSFHELCKAILKNPKNRLVILSHDLERLDGERLFENERVLLKKVESKEVTSYLGISDYAILLRRSAVTNRVASPSKFGEYLMAGCQVIISPEIGDFSEMVEKEELGIIYRGKKDNDAIKSLKVTDEVTRARIKKLAKGTFNRDCELNMIRYRNLKKLHDGK
jgi:hypothetical protein